MLIRIINYVLFGFALLFMGGCSKSNHQAQGYVEGRYTYIATSVSGKLQQLLVVRGSQVKQGQMLFALEEQPESDAYRAALENWQETIAARDAIQANLSYAKLTYERYQILVPKGAIEQARLDNAKSIYFSTLAQLAQANSNIAAASATLAQAKWKKEQKIGTAPLDALIFDTYYRLGEYVEANKAIMSLLAPADIKVIFYVPETVLGKLKLEDQVTVSCDGCRQPLTGKISFISPTAEYTPPVIYSTETNEKLIYRIEAAFAPQVAYQLHPGQPVYVSYLAAQSK